MVFLRIGIIIDSSGSMEESDPQDIRKVAKKIILDQLSSHENVFLIDFDSEA